MVVREIFTRFGIQTDMAAIRRWNKSIDRTKANLKAVSDVGRTAMTRLTLPIVGIGTAAIKASMDFSRGMAQVATLIPRSQERVEELARGVQDLAVEVGKGTADMTAGLYQVVSAFGDNEETLERLNIVARAATAGAASTTSALALLSAVTKGYGDTSAIALRKVSDLAFTTVKLGQTDFPALAASMGRVVPLAAQLGISQEELFSVFATLTGVTGNAAEVSTQFASALSAVIKPTEAMTEAAQKLGFRNATVMFRTLGLTESLRRLQKHTKGNEEAFGKLMVRKEALTLAFALLGGQADVYTEKSAKMLDVIGATNEAFTEQTTGVGEAAFKWAQFKVRVEVAAARLGDMLAPSLGKVIKQVERFIDWFDKLDQGTKDTIVTIAALTAALGPLLWIFGQFGMALTRIIGIAGRFMLLLQSMSRAAPLLAGLSAPVLVLLLLFALLAVIIAKNWKEYAEFLDYLKKTPWSEIKQDLKGWITDWEHWKETIVGTKNALVDLVEWLARLARMEPLREFLRPLGAAIERALPENLVARFERLVGAIPTGAEMAAWRERPVWEIIPAPGVTAVERMTPATPLTPEVRVQNEIRINGLSVNDVRDVVVEENVRQDETNRRRTAGGVGVR